MNIYLINLKTLNNIKKLFKLILKDFNIKKLLTFNI